MGYIYMHVADQVRLVQHTTTACLPIKVDRNQNRTDSSSNKYYLSFCDKPSSITLLLWRHWKQQSCGLHGAKWSKRCSIIIFWCPVSLRFLLLSYICMFFPVTGMNTWMNNWQRNDWTTASGGEVKNRADFERLNHASQGMNVTYVSELT